MRRGINNEMNRGFDMSDCINADYKQRPHADAHMRHTMSNECCASTTKAHRTMVSRMFVSLLAAALILPLSGCAGLCFTSYSDAQNARQNSLHSSLSVPTISEAGKLKVGYMEKAGVPQYEGDQNGQPTGLDIDVAAAVADELGLDLELIPVSSPASMANQSMDMVMGVTEQTADGLTVVSSYLESGVALFSKDSTEIKDVQDLVGKTIGYVKGTTTDAIVTGSNLQMQQITYSTLDDAFKGLEDGKITYVAAPAYPGASVAMDYDNIHFVCELSAPEKVGIGVEATNTKLIAAVEQALKEISDNGVLNLIDYRWTGTALELGGEGLANFTTSATNTDVSSDSTSSTSSSNNGKSSANPGDGSTAGTNALQNL